MGQRHMRFIQGTHAQILIFAPFEPPPESDRPTATTVALRPWIASGLRGVISGHIDFAAHPWVLGVMHAPQIQELVTAHLATSPSA